MARHDAPPSRHPIISYIVRTVELICGVITAAIIDYSVFKLHEQHWFFHVFSAAGHYTIIKFILMLVIPLFARISHPIMLVLDLLSIGLFGVGLGGYAAYEVETRVIETCLGDLMCTLFKVLFAAATVAVVAITISLILTGMEMSRRGLRYSGVRGKAKELDDEEILMGSHSPFNHSR